MFPPGWGWRVTPCCREMAEGPELRPRQPGKVAARSSWAEGSAGEGWLSYSLCSQCDPPPATRVLQEPCLSSSRAGCCLGLSGSLGSGPSIRGPLEVDSAWIVGHVLGCFCREIWSQMESSPVDLGHHFIPLSSEQTMNQVFGAHDFLRRCPGGDSVVAEWPGRRSSLA